MKRWLTLLLTLTICACDRAVIDERNNQFSVKEGQLYFTKQFISNWASDIQLPICNNCSKNVYSQYSPTGPMLFRQVNNENGDLVLLYATGVRDLFALNLGVSQYSVSLKMTDNKLQLSVDQKTVSLELNQRIKFQLDGRDYYVLLTKLNPTLQQKSNLMPQRTSYEADITIWQS